MDTKPTSKMPGSSPKNLALACSLFLHVGFITLVSYWQWELDTPTKNQQEVVKIKFLPASKAQKNTQKPTPVKAEHFSAAQPYAISSPSIPTLYARTPKLSTSTHQPVLWTKQARLSQKKRFKSRRVQPISIPVTEVRSPVFQPVKISQHNHSSTKTLTVRPLPIRKTHQLDSVQAAVPIKVQTTGQLKVAQRKISTRQTELWNTTSTEPQSAFLMKASISVSKSLHQRPVPATKSTGADTTIQPAAEPFKEATESQSRVAALPRKFPENPPTAPDNPSTSNIDTGVVRGLFAGKVRQRIANAKYYPRIARRRGIEGQPVVAFTLDKGGHLMEAGLAKTSGYQLLDQAALEAVQQAAPYPEIPVGLNAETFQFKLPISFILK
jgi:TonB family protein